MITKRTPIANVALFILGLTLTSFATAQEKKQEAPELMELPALTLDAQRYSRFYSSEQFDFAIDPDSIAIPGGDENEVRYTLKATSKQGAVNIDYEGIRCSSRQYIVYAVGVVEHKGGGESASWTRNRSPEWKKIFSRGNNQQHLTLANDFFCSGNVIADSLDSIRKRIKLNRPISNY